MHIHPSIRTIGLFLLVTLLFGTAYLGVFAGALATFFALLYRIGLLKTNLVTYLNPVVAMITGQVLLGDAVQSISLVGFVVIAPGFGLLEERDLVAELASYRGSGR